MTKLIPAYKLSLVLSISLLVPISNTLAQEALNDFTGSIPFADDRGYATDLVSPEGEPLFAEDVAIYNDPSLLNPEESSVWRPIPLPMMPTLSVENKNEVFHFQAVESSGISRLNFAVFMQDDGQQKKDFFRVHMSRQAHNVLLRAALLRKMGYRVPPMKHLRSFTLKFSSRNERDDFIKVQLDPNKLTAQPNLWVKNIRQKTLKSKKQGNGSKVWAVTSKTEGCVCLEIQDAVVYSHNSHIFNFPFGLTRKDFHQRRRVFEALLLPFAITYIDESINLLSWHFGTTVNNRFFVDYEARYQSEFFPTFSDAKWSARKLLALSRKDWLEIVEFGALPRAVSKVLLEKMISRRNDLIEVFQLKNEYQKLSFNPNVSYASNWGTELSNGKLLRSSYPGYVQQFAHGDQDSPISNSELFAFGKAKVIANVIGFLVDQFNENIAPRTNVEARIAEEQLQVAVDQLIESVKQGKFVEVPFGTYTVPYANSRLLISRDIVSGSVMGTENPIQIAHTFGWSVEAGALMVGYGLPENVSLGGRAAGFFTRTYTHLKPIRSIKTALKQPYKNVFVPMIKDRLGDMFEKIINGEFDDLNLEIDPEDLSKQQIQSRRDRENQLIEFFNDFSAEFTPGESLIITDYLGALGEVNAGYAIDQVLDLKRSVRLQAAAKADLQKIRRIHILRESEKAIQIYDDEGLITRLEFSLGLDAIGQTLVEVSAFSTVGGKAVNRAETRFVRLNTDTQRDGSGNLKNPQLLQNLKIFGTLLRTFDKDLLFSQREPTVLKHRFQQRGLKAQVLMWRYKGLNTLNDIDIEYDGEKRNYIRHSRGWRKGNNFEQFAIDTANTAISELMDEIDYKISTSSADDPGYTFLGSSRTRKVSFEGRRHRHNTTKQDSLGNGYGRVEHRWRGWSADRKKLNKIINELKAKYTISSDDRMQLFRPFDLKDTTKIDLYSITLNLHFYTKAINRMLTVSKKEVRASFKKMAKTMKWKQRGAMSDPQKWVSEKTSLFICLRNGGWTCPKKSFAGHQGDGNVNGQARRYTDMIHHLEDNLSWPIIVELLRDPKTKKNNLYVEVTVEGFRNGDEDVDPESLLHKPYRANSLGGIGDHKVRGPIDYIRRNLGMTESETFIYWILERL